MANGCGNFSSTWDKNYYLLVDAADEFLDFMYVYREENGVNKIPVLYFPPGVNEDTKLEIQTQMESFNFTIEAAEAMGGLWSDLLFDPLSVQTNDAGNLTIPFDLVTLYTPGPGGSIAETDKADGGFLVPVLYVEGLIAGFPFSVLLGGFWNTIIEWKQDVGLALSPIPAEETAAGLGVTFSVVDLVAYDFVAEGEEPKTQFNYFVIEHAPDGTLQSIEGNDPDPGADSSAVRVANVILPAFLVALTSAFIL
eukprot:Sro154_g070180.2  (252) ;mRNA; f:86996-87751